MRPRSNIIGIINDICISNIVFIIFGELISRCAVNCLLSKKLWGIAILDVILLLIV